MINIFAALIGIVCNDLASKHVLSLVQCESQPVKLWKNIGIENDANNLLLEPMS